MTDPASAQEVKFPQVYKLSHEGLEARLYAPNKYTAWRYKTMFIKEPETIQWVRALGADDILWDVGANVGVYTLYAALLAKCRVYAIEPGAANYWTLCKNIQMNRLDDRVLAYCIALGEEHKCAELFLQSSQAGGAQNALDRPLDDRGLSFKPQFKQGMLSIPADVLVGQLGLPCPTAIKIDVDGFEPQVLRGAAKTLANPTLRRVSLELNSANAELVATATTQLAEAGLQKTGEHRSPYVAANSPIHNFHFERR